MRTALALIAALAIWGFRYKAGRGNGFHAGVAVSLKMIEAAVIASRTGNGDIGAGRVLEIWDRETERERRKRQGR